MPEDDPSSGLDARTQRRVVRERYADVATGEDGDDRDYCSSDGCCDGDASAPGSRAELLGYDSEDVASAGVDCFLAAKEVGPTGRVIGVDMTPRWSSGPAIPRPSAAPTTWRSG